MHYKYYSEKGVHSLPQTSRGGVGSVCAPGVCGEGSALGHHPGVCGRAPAHRKGNVRGSRASDF